MGEITNFKGEVTAQDPDDPEVAVNALISRVGERVRFARERKGIPRRVLSEISGVSPRYLAQLEAGEGNISIGLLQRVAMALGHRIEWLLTDEDPWTSEVAQFSDLYRAASREARQQVRDILAPTSDAAMRGNRVCLIGLRGAGKSTLGAHAGAALGVPFVELNREIEAHSGMAVNEVLALYGQEGYRRLEAQALDRIVETYDSVILAVAGGIVAEPDTYKNLLAHFHTIWVKATPDEHMSRVRNQGDTRPMAGNPEAMEQLRSILTSREALYSRAEAELDTTAKTVEESCDELYNLIRDKGFF